MDENIKKENILVCLSSAPTNARIINTAARMAQAFQGNLTALFVQTPDYQVDTSENKQRLEENRKLAERLGAKIETVYGDDVAFQIAEFARLSGITKIVLGRSATKRKYFFSKPPLTEQLLTYVPQIDIHIIPDLSADNSYRPKRADNYNIETIFSNTLKSLAILVGATILSTAFYSFGFTNANIIMVYILGALLTAITTSHQIYSLISSFAGIIVFNYFFTAPRFSLAAYETGYPVTFVVMFLTAYITSTLAQRYKEQARQSAQIAHRTKTLFDTDKLLSKAEDKDAIIKLTAEQIVKLLGRNIVIFENVDGKLSQPYLFSPQKGITPTYNFEIEGSAAQWTLENNRYSGATTDQYPNASYMYMALRVNDRVYGVVGISAKNNPIGAYEHSILLSIIGECALALENQKNAKEKEEAAVWAESEQLRANLLRSISHDLRTPLTTISGNADNLIYNSDSFDEETKKEIYKDIYDDSIWLINLVENLLYSTRIEEGQMKLQTSTQLLSEIVEEAIAHIGHKADGHSLKFADIDELILVNVDARLLVQVIVNIIDNAIKYTRSDSHIEISISEQEKFATVKISDNGAGITDGEKEKVFQKFYSGQNKISDNRRSLGLGLYLCKAIIDAHGGKIWVEDNHPHGTVFCFTIPSEDVFEYE